ncbi:MAG: hypothetical protein ISR49_16260 [Alphaproteobacteria bacterium]|nr:hypothetical protein [Alphaproteobacteria bacterium]
MSNPFGGRYWTALILASVCGTNLGDFLPDILKLTPFAEAGAWVVLIGLSLAATTVSRMEALYWFAVLVLCSAGTSFADLLVGDARLGFEAAGALLLGVMAFALLIRQATERNAASKASPGFLFWVAFLAACALGTVLGDGIGHAFRSVKIGVPASALMATLAMLVSIGVGSRLRWRVGFLFWVALVAARWWGTNVGDIAKFLAGAEVCIGVGVAALIFVLILGRGANRGRAPSLPA